MAFHELTGLGCACARVLHVGCPLVSLSCGRAHGACWSACCIEFVVQGPRSHLIMLPCAWYALERVLLPPSLGGPWGGAPQTPAPNPGPP